MPDVCLTPAPPAPPVPVPYPNLGMNAMAVPFSPNVLLSNVPALSQASVIPMTSGDEGGVAHPTIKGPARFTMGNPIVKVNNLPAVNLLVPTTGNNMNDALGALVVPSVTNVFFTAAAGIAPAEGLITRGDLARLARAIDATSPEITLLGGGVLLVRPGPFGFATPSAVGEAIVRHARDAGARGLAAVVVDLRGNPGGDLAAAVDLASDFLPLGAIVARLVDAEGDERALRVRQEPLFDEPLVVLVDEGTASAAEVFAAALAEHGRAVVVGRATRGKATAQRAVAGLDGASAVYATVARVLTAWGRDLEGVGLAPHVMTRDDEDPEAALVARLGETVGVAVARIARER